MQIIPKFRVDLPAIFKDLQKAFLLFRGKYEQTCCLALLHPLPWKGWCGHGMGSSPRLHPSPFRAQFPDRQICKESVLAASLQLWEEVGLLFRSHSEGSCWKQSNLFLWQQHPRARQEELAPGRSEHLKLLLKESLAKGSSWIPARLQSPPEWGTRDTEWGSAAKEQRVSRCATLTNALWQVEFAMWFLGLTLAFSN